VQWQEHTFSSVNKPKQDKDKDKDKGDLQSSFGREQEQESSPKAAGGHVTSQPNPEPYL
jgi:hypothetical protein